MYTAHPSLAKINQIEATDAGDIEALANQQQAALSNAPLGSYIENFYLTNPIARASKVMNEMSALKYGQTEKATGTQ